VATKSQLRTRLQRRLGLGVVSPVESERLGEALNSGIARAISDGVPGLTHDTFVGSVSGELALTSATIADGGTTVTLVGADPTDTRVYPHDILQVVDSGVTTKFIIRDVVDDNEVDIGAPSPQAFTGDATSVILRRAIELPTTGQIISIHRIGGIGSSSRLAYEPLYTHDDPFKTGTPKFFEQRFSAVQNKSFVSLWPAPTEIADQFTIVQTHYLSRLDSDSDTLAFPEEALDAVLERARMAYLTWVGVHAPTTVAMAQNAVMDSTDSLKNTSNSNQIVVKQ